MKYKKDAIYKFYFHSCCYRPQTKFGARQYFHKRVSRILFTGGWGVPGLGVPGSGGLLPGA